MKSIEYIEKQMPGKRQDLLQCLREQNWQVVWIDDESTDWALDEKWVIESLRENKGYRIQLWFFNYDGLHDSMNRVVATPVDASPPPPYGGTPEIDFEKKKNFQSQIEFFIKAIHQLRCKGKLQQ